jgi:hypothetical protein
VTATGRDPARREDEGTRIDVKRGNAVLRAEDEIESGVMTRGEDTVPFSVITTSTTRVPVIRNWRAPSGNFGDFREISFG